MNGGENTYVFEAARVAARGREGAAGSGALARAVNLAAYATGGDGTMGNPWTGWAAAVTAGDTPYELAAGYFATAAPLSFTINRLKLYARPGAVLAYTGGVTAEAVLTFTCPSGTVGTQIEGVAVDGHLTVDGGGNAAGGVHAVGCHGSVFRGLIVKGVTDYVYWSQWAVSNLLQRVRYHSTYEGGTPPTDGIILDELPGGLTTVNTLRDCWIVGVPGTGLWLKNCFGNVVDGGAFEFCGTDLQCDGANNTVTGTGLEAGPSFVTGARNRLKGLQSGDDLTISGTSNSVTECYFDVVTVNAPDNYFARNQATYAGTHLPTDVGTVTAGGNFATTATGDYTVRVPTGKSLRVGTVAQAGGSPTLAVAAGGITALGLASLVGETVVSDGGASVGGSVGNGSMSVVGAAGSLNVYKRGVYDLSSTTAGDRWAFYADGSGFHFYTGTTGDVCVIQSGGKFLFPFGIGVGNSAAATTLGSVVKRVPVYDAAGSVLGYCPLYDAIT
jgi:hypothetical protein